MKIEVVEISELDNGDCDITLNMDDEVERLILEIGFMKILRDSLKSQNGNEVKK